jgi:antitoxin MazE
METRVQKWGHSLALRIPKYLARELGIADQSAVTLSLRDGELVIARLDSTALTLEQLLAGVTEENLHGEVDTGPAVGDEAC